MILIGIAGRFTGPWEDPDAAAGRRALDDVAEKDPAISYESVKNRAASSSASAPKPRRPPPLVISRSLQVVYPHFSLSFPRVSNPSIFSPPSQGLARVYRRLCRTLHAELNTPPARALDDLERMRPRWVMCVCGGGLFGV